ncbi:MAG: glycoside hydrolase family 3 protein [Janthinobacterium lividum]
MPLPSLFHSSSRYQLTLRVITSTVFAFSLGAANAAHAQMSGSGSSMQGSSMQGSSMQGPHPLSAVEQAKVEDIVHRMTLEEKLAYIGGTGFAVRAMPGLHLPSLEMSDGPYGVRSNSGLQSTTYVAGIGLAASWDRALAAKVGEGIGRDGRARGIHYQLGPGTNIYRSPMNGRNFEYFGEDPYLAGEMVTGYVTGMQSTGVSATVKHYVANNSEFLRHDSDSIVDERALREIYLPAFEAAVKKGHVGAVMDSYNLINGKHATENVFTNIDVMRKDWGFQGTMMSDWDATYDAVGAANGGLDLEMPTGKFMNAKNLMPAIQAGKVSQATIDEKVRHILTTAEMFGWLDRDQRDNTISYLDVADNKVALQSAREAVTLLKNDGNLLPLNKGQIKTVLVVGPDAYPGTPVGGGSAGVVPFHNISLLEGMSAAGEGVTVLFDPGLPSLSDLANHTDFMTAATGGQPGLLMETFESKDLSGTAQQGNVRHINVTGVGWDEISGDLNEMMEAIFSKQKDVSHRYTGYYNAATAGEYLVALANSGEGNGDRVYLDDKLVIDDWQLVRAFEPHFTAQLSAGMHKVVVENRVGGAIGGKLRFAIAPVDKVVNERAKELAAKADVVIVAAGYSNHRDLTSESEGGDRTFDLPFGQDALIQAMAAANPKTVVTVTSGGNVDSTTWIDKVPALAEGWYGGQAGGQAMAEVLFGSYNPGGHLPATFERRAEDNPTFANYYPEGDSKRVVYKEGIFVGYRGYEKNNVKPLFPFGYGLSYTTFGFSNLKVNKGAGTGMATAEFDVTNSGQRTGAEVAQVYVSDTHARVPRPMHELKGFERVELAPGQTKHVSVALDARSFAYWDEKAHHWTIDPGKFTISVGDSVASLPLSGTVEVSRENAREAKF